MSEQPAPAPCQTCGGQSDTVVIVGNGNDVREERVPCGTCNGQQ